MSKVSLLSTWPIRLSKNEDGKYCVCLRVFNPPCYVAPVPFNSLFCFEREIVDIPFKSENGSDYFFAAITKGSGENADYFIEKISYNNDTKSVTREVLCKCSECPVYIFKSLYAYKNDDGMRGLINFEKWTLVVGDENCLDEYMTVINATVSEGALYCEMLPLHEKASVATFIVIKQNMDGKFYLEQIVVDLRMCSLPNSRRYHVRKISNFVDVEYLAPGIYQGIFMNSKKGLNELSFIDVSHIFGNAQGIKMYSIEHDVRTHLKKCGCEVKRVISKVFPRNDKPKFNERELVVILSGGVTLYFALMVDEKEPDSYKAWNTYYVFIDNKFSLKYLDSALEPSDCLAKKDFFCKLSKIRFENEYNFRFTGRSRNDSQIPFVSPFSRH